MLMCVFAMTVVDICIGWLSGFALSVYVIYWVPWPSAHNGKTYCYRWIGGDIALLAPVLQLVVLRVLLMPTQQDLWRASGSARAARWQTAFGNLSRLSTNLDLRLRSAVSSPCAVSVQNAQIIYADS